MSVMCYFFLWEQKCGVVVNWKRVQGAKGKLQGEITYVHVLIGKSLFTIFSSLAYMRFSP